MRAKEQAARGPVPPVGRNEPCPCGSGKKYKKCHLRADSPPRRAPVHDLDGRVPRGRERVDVLLKDMEDGEARQPADERFAFGPIRKELGL